MPAGTSPRRTILATGRWRLTTLLAAGLTLAFLGSGCSDAPEEKPREKPAEKKVVPVGTNVSLEVQGDRRRVLVSGQVCLREGILEGLLTRQGAKEHEYVLSADVDARQVHAALEAAGGKPGSPVRFEPRYRPAHGSVVQVTLRYQQGGRTITVPAREWVRDGRAKKPLAVDWVFGGSRLVPNPVDPKGPKLYLANEGDVICLCNMETALLDLPVKSPKSWDDRVYDAFTDHIPPVGTKVTIILEPVKNR
jgi:hypothetical protein